MLPPLRPAYIIAIGLATVIVGVIVTQAVVKPRLNSGIEDELIIQDLGERRVEQWRTNTDYEDDPMDFEFYMYNLTNSAQLLASPGVKPQYEILGPYRFYREFEKFDIELSEDKKTLEYYTALRYFVKPDTFGDPIKDMITNVNPGFVGILQLSGSEQKVVFPLTGPSQQGYMQLLANLGITLDIVPSINSTVQRILDLEAPRNWTLSEFCSVWTNSTYNPEVLWTDFLPSELPLAATNISLNSCLLLFDPNPANYSLVNAPADKMVAWFYLERTSPTLQALFQLTEAQVVAVANWITAYRDARVWPITRAKFDNNPYPIVTKEDLGILQMGKAAVIPAGTRVTFPSIGLPGDEYALYQSAGMDFFVLKNLYLDPVVGVYNPLNMGEFLKLCQAAYGGSDLNLTIAEMIQAKWGIEPIDSFGYSIYLQNMYAPRIASPELQYYYNLGGYLFTSRSVVDWLFYAVDPLVQKLNPARSLVAIFRNNTDYDSARFAVPGKTKVRTGLGEYKRLEELVEFEGRSVTPYWREPEPVSGNEATQWSPAIGLKDTHKFWMFELARAIDLKYTGDHVSARGISLRRYVEPEDIFAPNPQYYQTIQGFANLTAPRGGIPIYISKPFFYGVDSKYTEKVAGVDPQRGKDFQSFYDLEPHLGTVMRGYRRSQVNIYLANNGYLDGNARNVPVDTFYPIVCLSGGALISESRASTIKNTVIRIDQANRDGYIATLTIGILLIVFGLGVFGYQWYHPRKPYVEIVG
eukprot:TRINITY_DN1698_c0_g1_i1.p1 TRINITY_DN1698_c0_g1~~TRINITY_DN1698_c0_g1_i1.p1  ORF type:complete len:753 (+),score=188.33 TRINITY_DN1698_c0_g1_i1:1-2259(+)